MDLILVMKYFHNAICDIDILGYKLDLLKIHICVYLGAILKNQNYYYDYNLKLQCHNFYLIHLTNLLHYLNI